MKTAACMQGSFVWYIPEAKRTFSSDEPVTVQLVMQACTTPMLSSLDSDGWFTKTSADVGVLATKVSRWSIVADSEVWSNVATSVLKSVASNSCTPNFLGVSPNNLGEMAPYVEVAHVWVVLTIQSFVCRSFIIVHAVGNHGWDVLRRRSSTNVLSITSAVLRLVGRAGIY